MGQNSSLRSVLIPIKVKTMAGQLRGKNGDGVPQKWISAAVIW
jgi:hypothetical protein